MRGNRHPWKRLLRWLVAVLALYGSVALPSLYGDFLWFAALDYESVFLTILAYWLGLFVLTAGISALVLYGSYRIATQNLQRSGARPPPWRYRAAIIVLAVLIGLVYASAWDTVLRFIHATSFDIADPISGLDVAFYVYTLPFLNLIVGYLVVVTAAGLGLSMALYGREFVATTGQGDEESAGGTVTYDPWAYVSYLRAYAYTHIVSYIGVLLVLLGVLFFLDRYELLFSPRGVVFGMGATDRAVFLPLLGLLTVTSLLGGLVVLASRWMPDARAVYVPIALLIGFLLLGHTAGAVYQEFVVEPDELNKEEQYLEHEIKFTNRAYALDRIEERQFPVSDTLTRGHIDDNPGTIDNVRLWDPRPLLTTYNELQIFRTYYQFTDVDIDRYEVDGQKTQVMVSARELEFQALPPESQTWVNRHLVYTHGFGVAMSPVSSVTADGLPTFYIKDIPPQSSAGINVTQPRIYYGETTTDYAIVNTNTRELDYPSGGQNVYTSYKGDGGILLDSALRELVYSIKFLDPRIVLSDSVTSESRLQFHRDIQTRAPTIAPFLEYDRDPYVVASNGKLYWIYDAYTTTDTYPYSDRVRFKGDRVNYVRNSVKVVVDAHTGETTYYVAEPDDPLIRTYRKAFPGLFKDFEEMPAGLRQHVRYPEDAFRVQAQQYLTYHMKDPRVFYNKEDAWRIPNEVARGAELPMDPYYIIMTFPGADDPEFVMIQPYIPEGRQNMIGWLAARSDPPNYGTLKAFRFSKQRLIFGPMQIESRIDQDADISQQITLWSQAGSSVIRGNLLAIPIGDTIIYVEPLFLESREQGALPELKRVILVHGDRVTMQPSLERAIAVQAGVASPAAPSPGAGLSPAELDRARTLYDEAQAALQRGDFETYAQKISALGELLEASDAQQEGNTTGR
ncbi:UPF0182 family protein [Haloarcula sp. JP-L23]|uniref:UPF0182 family membrane protein n=1 Tax=Haloarcula sp. JP-L23 TaxID=2716717 RepID=UPI00140F0888|nr:UPF0182 family protein [Haloarcula sp. JP-L23]